MSVADGVVMFRQRVVVPRELRPVVLEVLHGAHQGVYSMQLRADKAVWWPGMSADITGVLERCL